MLGRGLRDCASAAGAATADCKKRRRSIRITSSEFQAHAQFDLSGGQRRRDLAECGGAERGVRISEIRVIHEIEELAAKLEIGALANGESPLNGDVAIEKPRRPHDADAFVAELERR